MARRDGRFGKFLGVPIALNAVLGQVDTVSRRTMFLLEDLTAKLTLVTVLVKILDLHARELLAIDE